MLRFIVNFNYIFFFFRFPLYPAHSVVEAEGRGNLQTLPIEWRNLTPRFALLPVTKFATYMYVA